MITFKGKEVLIGIENKIWILQWHRESIGHFLRALNFRRFFEFRTVFTTSRKTEVEKGTLNTDT